jgi:hypothetical protein
VKKEQQRKKKKKKKVCFQALVNQVVACQTAGQVLNI